MLKKLLRLFNNQSRTITSAAFIVGVASLVSRLLGLFRDRVLAGEFGAGSELDMYYAAFRIPDLVFNLIVLGALSVGFIPIFTEYLKKDKLISSLTIIKSNKAWQLTNAVLNFLVISLILICGVLVIFTPILMRIITPGFSLEQLKITTVLTRIMFLSPILLGISSIWGGVLQSLKRFFVYSLAPIMYNIGIIFGALFLVKFWGVYGLAWGVVLGALLHMLVQMPLVFSLGYRYKWFFDWSYKGLREIIHLMIPRTLSLATSQINFLVVTIIGSTLAAGSLAVFNLANNLQSFPLGIFALSFAIAAFPTLSELADKKEKFIESFSLAMRQIMFFLIPASAILIVLRAQIVRIILGWGRFDWQDTVLTFQTLAFFALSLFAQGAIFLLIRAYFAQKDSKTPFIIGLFSALLNIILCLILIKKFDVSGLALAYSFSSIFNALLLWLILRLRLGNLDELKITISVFKILVATFIMTLVIQALKYILEPIFGTQTFLGITSQGILAGLSGLGVYILICFVLKSPEIFIFIDSLKKKFLKKYKPVEIIEGK